MSAAASALLVACVHRHPPLRFRRPSARPRHLFFLHSRMDSGATLDRVPPFQAGPLITWGPPPDGVTHPERARTYDLQHQ